MSEKQTPWYRRRLNVGGSGKHHDPNATPSMPEIIGDYIGVLIVLAGAGVIVLGIVGLFRWLFSVVFG